MFGLAARLIGGMVTPLLDQVSDASARLLRKLALFFVAAMALVVVLIALTVAFDLWIASKAGPIVGALAVAGLYLAVGGGAVFLALRPNAPRPSTLAAEAKDAGQKDPGQNDTGKAKGEAGFNAAQVDDFAAPLLGILESLGLRREQLAVLAGTSLAKQLGPVPLLGLAIVAGFLVGRMWRGLISADLIATVLALFGAAQEAKADGDDAEDRDAA